MACKVSVSLLAPHPVHASIAQASASPIIFFEFEVEFGFRSIYTKRSFSQYYMTKPELQTKLQFLCGERLRTCMQNGHRYYLKSYLAIISSKKKYLTAPTTVMLPRACNPPPNSSPIGCCDYPASCLPACLPARRLHPQHSTAQHGTAWHSTA